MNSYEVRVTAVFEKCINVRAGSSAEAMELGKRIVTDSNALVFHAGDMTRCTCHVPDESECVSYRNYLGACDFVVTDECRTCLFFSREEGLCGLLKCLGEERESIYFEGEE